MAAHLTIEQQQQILDLRAEGKTYAEIIRETNSCFCTVSRICKRGKPQVAYSLGKRYIKAEEKRKEIMSLIKQGYDYIEISKRVGYCRAYLVSLYGKDRNLKRKTRKGAIVRLETWCKICDEIIVIEMTNAVDITPTAIDMLTGWSYRIVECPRCKQSYSWDVLVNRTELERAWADAFIVVDDEE